MQLVRRAQPWLGTLVEIGLQIVPRAGTQSELEADAQGAITQAFHAVARVHRAMSRQAPTSDIGRFNIAAAGTVIDCDPWTLQVLALASRVHELSAGAFDISLGSGDWFGLHDRVLVKRDARVQLDLGGIAKGYAVDRAVCVLRANGMRAGWVNAGGDLRVFGTAELPVQVRNAVSGAAGTQVLLSRGSLASSQYVDGTSPTRHDRLIDGRTARTMPVTTLVSVAASRCAVADALTKVIALTGDLRHPALVHFGAQAWLN